MHKQLYYTRKEMYKKKHNRSTLEVEGCDSWASSDTKRQCKNNDCKWCRNYMFGCAKL